MTAHATSVKLNLSTLSRTAIVTSKSTGEAIEIGEPTNAVYNFDAAAGTYVVTVCDTKTNKDGSVTEATNGTIEMDVPDSSDQFDVKIITCTLYARNTNEDKSNWTVENGDYTFNVKVASREGKTQIQTPGKSTTEGRYTFLAFNGNSYFVDFFPGEKHVSEQVTDTAKPETTPVLKKEDMAGSGHKGEENAAGNSAGNAFLQNLTGQLEEVEAPAERPVYAQPETNQIMDQIVEYMKFNLKPEMQEMEMQLHPASLGTVHVQIAAKDGVITAQFAAQNETVKAVLETQMIQLKEQFEEQGIKVEAVEVTVANHAYGEQFGGEREAEQNGQNAKKSARRINLNLDEMEGEGLEELDDSERIAVEMMQANGNTVDYTA